jgi:outer membrane protein OmpA-like peptidoglycan-associated protein
MELNQISIKMKTINKLVIGSMLIGLSLGSFSCGTSNAVKGGAIGGAAGGALGGVMAGGENTALGVILGSAIGGSAGAIIGKQMDRQAEELEKDLENAEIERVGEGIKITFDSGLMFPIDQSSLTEKSKQNLIDLAETLKKYEDTNILVEGHTDNTGKEEYNLNLSKERANSVKNYLSSLGVDQKRLELVAFGETNPIASNDTEVGRQKNRRVEVAIYANKKMQKAAKRGDLGEI